MFKSAKGKRITSAHVLSFIGECLRQRYGDWCNKLNKNELYSMIVYDYAILIDQHYSNEKLDKDAIDIAKERIKDIILAMRIKEERRP